MTGGIECPKYEEVCPFVPSSKGAAPDVGPSETLRNVEDSNSDQAMSGELSSSTGHGSSSSFERKRSEMKSSVSDAPMSSATGKYMIKSNTAIV
ncbi:hypothetical protein DQ04_21161000 [Trypanosoma grayi]|uniref:hypothetical protein n=1 Tax=Trypanosoma grayi TaxID=71804 RepID=UPI0004F46311|nr:hypothetical protein DQ04_21161000 [Trypanosoma grayi]KEG05508.1 hypothetical protein DQ04_21161000 [Trypanosoma grayi]